MTRGHHFGSVFWLSALGALTLFSLLAAPTPALAETCAGEPVTARGEPSRFVWFAKTKARANWRRKVRATPELGAEMAVWNRAMNAEERCLTGPSGTVCIFTGVPCKP